MRRTERDVEFSQFVRDHRVDLLRSACLLTAGDVHAAEDAVQVALARLYVAWPRARRAQTPLAYARRAVVNAFLDETRRARWRRERPVADADRVADGVLEPGPEPHAAVVGDDVRAALAALAPRMRAVVVLRFWLDLGVEETADLLGCTQGTVKSQSAKAVARLRALLTDGSAGAVTTPGRTS